MHLATRLEMRLVSFLHSVFNLFSMKMTRYNFVVPHYGSESERGCASHPIHKGHICINELIIPAAAGGGGVRATGCRCHPASGPAPAAAAPAALWLPCATAGPYLMHLLPCGILVERCAPFYHWNSNLKTKAPCLVARVFLLHTAKQAKSTVAALLTWTAGE